MGGFGVDFGGFGVGAGVVAFVVEFELVGIGEAGELVKSVVA